MVPVGHRLTEPYYRPWRRFASMPSPPAATSSRARAPSTIRGTGTEDGLEWLTLSTALGSPPPGGFRPGGLGVVDVAVDPVVVLVPLPDPVVVVGFEAGGTGVLGVIFVPLRFSSAFAFCRARRMSSWALE